MLSTRATDPSVAQITEAFSDSTMTMISGVDRNQLSPSSTHKRNARNRKSRAQHAIQSDGVVSESALSPSISPKLKTANKGRQAATAGVVPGQHTYNTRKSSNSSQRPVPLNYSATGTPSKEQAYAGPTFQASPAASNLPIPKFMSKSAPNVAGKLSLQARLAGDRSPEDQPSSPEPEIVRPPDISRDTQQSPLDLFFKADRAEREKVRITSQTPQPHERKSTALNASPDSSKSAFLSELDGERDMLSHGDKSISANAIQTRNGTHRPLGANVSSDNGDEERQAYTQSLKDLLFSTTVQPLSTPPRQHEDRNTEPQSANSVYFTPQQPTSQPSTPNNDSDRQSYHPFHYGNRNLSPLFKAARSETLSRPSSLRQEVPCDAGSTTDSAVDVNSPPPHLVQQSPQYRKHHSPYHTFYQPEFSPVAPAYPEQQPRNLLQPTHTQYPSSRSSAAPVGGWNPQQAPTNTYGGGAHDIRTMEDDLRRILKLNVLN